MTTGSGKARGKRTLKTGAVGAAIFGICCFTPILVVTLGAIGFSAWLSWADYVLFPGLFIFLCLIGYGLWQLKSN